MNTLGAHEVLELHEVLNDAIHGLNTMRLYRPYARDRQLQEMMDRHIQALTMEYNQMVQMAHQQGASQAIPARGSMNLNQASFQPIYGLDNPVQQAPAPTQNQLGDMDVTNCIITCHKQTAALKMKAALEMANPTLRQFMKAAASFSADLAYEGFQYANAKGYYQVPTLKDTTMNTYMQSYTQAQFNQPQYMS